MVGIDFEFISSKLCVVYIFFITFFVKSRDLFCFFIRSSRFCSFPLPLLPSCLPDCFGWPRSLFVERDLFDKIYSGALELMFYEFLNYWFCCCRKNHVYKIMKFYLPNDIQNSNQIILQDSMLYKDCYMRHNPMLFTKLNYQPYYYFCCSLDNLLLNDLDFLCCSRLPFQLIKVMN